MVFSLLLSSLLYAQNPDLEMTSTSQSSGNGPTLNSGVFTFLKNSDNPSGTTYAAYTPALTATYTISNPQYTGTNGTFATTPRSPLVFGVSNGSATAIISSFIGTPSDNFFTASGATAGTGIVTGTTAAANRGVRIYCSTYPLRDNGVPTNATPYIGDITITFNRPVNNPILHISGTGGASGTQAFFGEFELTSINGSASPPASGTLTKLSGTTPIYVSGNYIGNNSNGNYTQITTGGAADGSGSVQVNGTGITTLTFKYYLKGAPFDGTAQWATTPATVGIGEALTMSVSTLESDLALTQTASTSTPSTCNSMTFTLTASNNGISNSANTLVNALIPSGYTYISSVASAGTYDNTTGVWNIGTLNNAASATLTITVKANDTGSYAFTSTISGDNADNDTTNNSATTTTTPTACVVTNTCPVTSVDLTTAFAVSAPSGATLSWHTATPAASANMLTAAQAGNITTSGTYYAAFYDSGNGCYSPTTAVQVNIVTCACYNDANTAVAGIDSKFGITLLKRAGSNNGNWPMLRKSAHTVLESNTKGFVITRMAKANLGNITNPQEGMMVYDTTDKCLKIYDGTVWSCFNQPACP